MKKSNILYLCASLLMVCSLIYSNIGYAAPAPKDISKHWAKDAITSANVAGWAYIENGKFNPNKAATREEVTWMLVGACKTVQIEGFDINKKADMTKFKDKPSSWAQDRIAVAVGNAFVSGYSNGTLKPKANITRAELVVILGRLSKTPESSNFLPFWDSIPLWAVNEVEKTYALKIVTGYADGSFKPNAKVTKAEALVMMQRWKKLQSPIPAPACEEFQKIAKTLSGTTIDDHKTSIYYYGKDGKKEANVQNKFSIARPPDGSFTIYVNEFNEETYMALETALKEILPKTAGKVVSEIKILPQFGIKDIKGDDKNIHIQASLAYVMIRITK